VSAPARPAGSLPTISNQIVRLSRDFYSISDAGKVFASLNILQQLPRPSYQHLSLFLLFNRALRKQAMLECVSVLFRRDVVDYFEMLYPYKDKIVAAGIDDARFLEELYPGLRFVHADALDLPFEDGAFDYVHSSAVLEHVGCFENSARWWPNVLG
jgi:hypothetical protein